MTRTEATGLAKSYIAARNAQSGLDLVLVEDETLEQDFGWIFFFHSKTYMESGDPLDSVIGGGPIIVDASTGEVHPLGQARLIEVFDSIRNTARSTHKPSYQIKRESS